MLTSQTIFIRLMYKFRNNLVLLILASFLVFSCGSDKKNDDSEETIESSNDNKKPVAVCLWEKVGVRENPGIAKDNKYLATAIFGEKVELLGERKTIDSENREYIKVKLSDGTKGWVYSYLFAENATLAAFTKKSKIYQRPDMMTSTNKNFEEADLVAIIDNQDGGKWKKVVGKKKSKKGWVKDNSQLSMDETDLAVAVQLGRANSEKSPSKRKEKLKEILDSPDFESSAFYNFIKSKLEDDEIPDEDDENSLFVIGNKVNLRSNPSLNANVEFQLNDGDYCKILKKSSSTQEIDGFVDYWYKISINGDEAWIFGYFTSKRLID